MYASNVGTWSTGFCGVIFGWDIHDRVYSKSSYSTVENGTNVAANRSVPLSLLSLSADHSRALVSLRRPFCALVSLRRLFRALVSSLSPPPIAPPPSP